MLRINYDNFPHKNSERVEYAMDIVGMLLIERGSRIPTSNDPIKLYEICNDVEEMQYLWTAAMLYGENLSGMRFKRGAIQCSEKSCFGRLVDQTPCYEFAGRHYVYDPVDQSNQMGWLGTFSNSSLYETKFKKHIVKDMFSLEKYRNISSTVLGSKRKAEKRLVNY